MSTRGEDGVGVVVILGLTGLLLLVATVGGGLSAVLVAHRRAEAAADLGALAGAGAVRSGKDPCSSAAAVAGRNGARAESCAVDGADVQVVVAVDLPSLLGSRSVRARARAGPADPFSAPWPDHPHYDVRPGGRE